MTNWVEISSSVWNTNDNTSMVTTPKTLPINNSVFKPNDGRYQLWVIQSPREPYAVEYLVNQYGGLGTKLGTNMGSNR